MLQINITEANSATLLNKIITPLKNQSLLTDEDLTALQPYLEKVFKNIEILMQTLIQKWINHL